MVKIICVFSMILVFIAHVKTDYVAAVVEYQIINSTNPNTTVQSNVDEYLRYIENAKRSSAKIIVFPEYGLTGFVVDPTNYSIEIPKTGAGPVFTDHWLNELSNAAIAHGMYVVVNLLEKDKNEKNETIFYNTNIVFDKIGKIAAKYRKINLQEEPKLTPGKASENQVTFSTDFGITFGLFTGFDIFFYNPSRSILVNTSVTDVLLPTAWYSTLPFFHSLSFHSAYAQANKVNLLASNVNFLPQGIGGSGIYGAEGTAFSYYISGSSSSKLLIANVSNTVKDFNYQGFDLLDGDDIQPTMDNYKAGRSFDSNCYRFKDLNLSQKTISEEICHGQFCCQFNITLSSENTPDIYKLMAYVGPTNIGGNAQNNVKICSLLACETTAPSTCGTKNVNITSQFQSISVRTEVENVVNEFYQPITLTKKLIPIFNSTYNSTVANGRRTISFSTNLAQKEVVAFGIYGSSSAMNLGFSFTLLVISMVAKYLL